MKNHIPSIIPTAGQQLKPVPRRQYSQSPTRAAARPPDDLISDLAPATAVDSLRNPSPTLRRCLNGATHFERAFVTRTAEASQSIQKWLEELRDWPWPVTGGASGFHACIVERGRTTTERPRSVPLAEVPRYEKRIEEMSHEMEKLNIEEIKQHVMHNHIMPLSRPGTPASVTDSDRFSSVSFARMDDLTAVVTALVIQALPNLSRLSRLMNVWVVRLAVLHQVPLFLSSIEDAEAALQSAWDAISGPSRATAAKTEETGPRGGSSSGGGKSTIITSKDFRILQLVLEKKVTGPGRILDYMLDSLEGLDDTLPDEWLHRMESAERGYGEWVAAGEARMREAEWVKVAEDRASARGTGVEPGRVSGETNSPEGSPATPTISIEPPVDSDLRGESGRSSRADGILTTAQVLEQSSDELPSDAMVEETKLPPRSDLETSAGQETASDGSSSMRADSEVGDDWVRLSPVDEHTGDDTLQLPPLSQYSQMSDRDAAHGAVAGLQTSLMPPYVLPEYVDFEDDMSSSASSPPLRARTGPPACTVLDSPSQLPIPSIEEDDEEDLRPTTPYTDSFIEGLDDSPSLPGTPRQRGPEDDKLQQQISNILESIPAKFTLSSRPAPVNLNPPDFKPPHIKTAATSGAAATTSTPAVAGARRPAREPARRSVSALSSRASTPGFTLAPAFKTSAGASRSRPRSAQQDIKMYHLSRSTGEAPIKLFIRCVGEKGERVMVRVGGGWADLGEYLKEYATHHGRRSAGPVEVRDIPRVSRERSLGVGSSPPSRPGSALGFDSPVTPLHVRKTRRSFGAAADEGAGYYPAGRRPALLPKTPAAAGIATAPAAGQGSTPPSENSTRSRSSSRLSWGEEDSPMLGLAGPTSRPVEMSEESRAWVESVKEKVRLASGEFKGPSSSSASSAAALAAGVGIGPERRDLFGEMGRVGGTKRLYRKKGHRESQGHSTPRE